MTRITPAAADAVAAAAAAKAATVKAAMTPQPTQQDAINALEQQLDEARSTLHTVRTARDTTPGNPLLAGICHDVERDVGALCDQLAALRSTAVTP